MPVLAVELKRAIDSMLDWLFCRRPTVDAWDPVTDATEGTEEIKPDEVNAAPDASWLEDALRTLFEEGTVVDRIVPVIL
jgi:hypothetical protein